MDNAKKKRIKRYITWAAMAAVVLLLAAMPLIAQQEAEADGPVASIHTETVQTGSISTTLRGGGTLAADGAEDVIIPTGVKITEFLVKNGDYVQAGTPLAAVDKVSVMTAVTGVMETLDYLQEELADAREESVDATIRATAGGRIKKVFAREGESVQDVMLRDGALALLSIDGLMAVKIEKHLDIRTGEAVTVTLTDGTGVTGRVESNLDGVVIITVDDEGYTIGEAVTVTETDGTVLGVGTLYVHNAWKATAYSGTISTVSAKEEKTVSAGATLFTLKDTDYTGQLEYLAGQHREYEELLQDLFKMYESGTIDAPCEGLISGVDEESTHLLSAPAGTVQAALLTANHQGSWQVVLLGTGTPVCSKNDQCQVPPAETHEDGCIMACDRAATCDATVHHSDCIKSCDHADTAEGCDATGSHYPDCIRSCSNAKTEGGCSSSKHYFSCIGSCKSSDGTTDCPATGAHKADCIKSCTRADVLTGCEATTHHYNDCIKKCANSQTAATVCTATKHQGTCYYYGMTYKATAAKIFAVGNELVVYTDMSGKEYTVERSGSGWSVVGEQINTATLIGPEASIAAGNASAFKGKEGSIILIITGVKGSETTYIGPVLYQSAGSQFPGGYPSFNFGSLDISSMIGGFGGFGNYNFGGAVQTEEDKLYDLDGSTLMTVTPQKTMTLTIALDEHDIAKVNLGDTATVKVEALRGNTFPAQVTNIAIGGSSKGGSSKFAVELTLSVAEDMLAGMSATAIIPLETQENVALIPLKALNQAGAKTVVYTALDDKSGEPARPVEVQTGISDGENVQILSGLAPGDTICYSYYDILELDTSAEAERYSFS